MAMVEESPLGSPCWFDLMTDNVPAARDFYAAVFGWEYVRSGPETNHYSMATAKGRNAAGIGQKPAEAPYPNVWTVYIGVSDVQATCDASVEKGAKIEMPPLEVPSAGHMAILQDATGAAFGLWQPTGHKGFQIKGEHGSFAWCEVYSRDHDAARDFYGELFGLESTPMDSPHMTYSIMKKGFPVFGVMQMGEQFGEMPPHWMCYFAVDDADVAAAKVTEHGGKVVHGPLDSPFGRMAVCSDPGGAHFSVIVPQQG